MQIIHMHDTLGSAATRCGAPGNDGIAHTDAEAQAFTAAAIAQIKSGTATACRDCRNIGRDRIPPKAPTATILAAEEDPALTETFDQKIARRESIMAHNHGCADCRIVRFETGIFDTDCVCQALRRIGGVR